MVFVCTQQNFPLQLSATTVTFRSGCPSLHRSHAASVYRPPGRPAGRTGISPPFTGEETGTLQGEMLCLEPQGWAAPCGQRSPVLTRHRWVRTRPCQHERLRLRQVLSQGRLGGSAPRSFPPRPGGRTPPCTPRHLSVINNGRRYTGTWFVRALSPSNLRKKPGRGERGSPPYRKQRLGELKVREVIVETRTPASQVHPNPHSRALLPAP